MNFSREKLFKCRFLSCENEEKANNTNRILKLNELLRFEDTEKYKIGNGKDKAKDLPYLTKLPEYVYMYID